MPYFTHLRSPVGSQTPYNKTPSGEAYLYVSKSRVVGVGNADTGLGLFTYEDIPKNTYVCSYAPTASLKSTPQDGDYAMQLTVAGERISVNGKENPNEIGLGIFANDGSFPLSLVPEKFSRLVSARVNCEFSKRDSEVWIKTTRDVKKKEELLVCYSSNGSYWNSLFNHNQIREIKEALLRCGPTLRDAEMAYSSLDISR